MSCDGCRFVLKKRLNEIPGVQAEVTLHPVRATLSMEKSVPDSVLQKELAEAGDYWIKTDRGDNDLMEQDPAALHNHGGQTQPFPEIKKASSKRKSSGSGIYYCPMHREGDKTYDRFGHCPVCGMDLVEQPVSNQTVQ